MTERFKAVRKCSYTLEVQNNFKDFPVDDIYGCMDEEQLPRTLGTINISLKGKDSCPKPEIGSNGWQ